MDVESSRPAAVTGNPLIASCMVETMRVVGRSRMIPPAMTRAGDRSTPAQDISRAIVVRIPDWAAMVKNSGIRQTPSRCATTWLTTEDRPATSAPSTPPPMPTVMVIAAAAVAARTIHRG